MLEAWGGGGCSRTGPTFEQWDGYAGFFCDTDYTGHGIQPAPRNAGAQMLIQDNHTGKYWLLGPGHAHWVTTQSDIDLLHYLGVPDEYLSDPLVVISRMMTFGAWDTATNTPKTA